jgi:hypothetical protein
MGEMIAKRRGTAEKEFVPERFRCCGWWWKKREGLGIQSGGIWRRPATEEGEKAGVGRATSPWSPLP